MDLGGDVVIAKLANGDGGEKEVVIIEVFLVFLRR